MVHLCDMQEQHGIYPQLTWDEESGGDLSAAGILGHTHQWRGVPEIMPYPGEMLVSNGFRSHVGKAEDFRVARHWLLLCFGSRIKV